MMRMLHKYHIVPVLFTASIILMSQKSYAVTVDFDDAVGHNVEIPADHYAGFGITLDNATWVGEGFAEDGLGGLGVTDGVLDIVEDWQFPGENRPIQVHFITPVTEVNINAMNGGENGARIEAYDGDTLVDFDEMVGIGFGQDNVWDLFVTAESITRVTLFQVNSPTNANIANDGVHFDNLEFIPIPEPSSIFLATSVLAALAWIGLRNRERGVSHT